MQSTATVRAVHPFDPFSDAATLRKAMKGFGTDESSIVRVLTQRSNAQRQEIKVKYQASIGRDLMKDLKDELSGNLEDVIVALMTPWLEFMCKELHDAMNGLGTNEKTLIEIICPLDNATIRSLKTAYHKMYGKTLEESIKSETSGDFQHLLIALCAACREEHNTDMSVVPTLVEKLYSAGEKKWGTNESEFNRILCIHSFPVLRGVFQEYQKFRGKSFDEVLEAECSGDLMCGLKAICCLVHNRPLFYAQELHDAMKGTGTRDTALIRLIVSRSEIDLGSIRQVYLNTYGVTLEKAIETETGGDYKKVLLALVKGV